jgi:hypothetical protein
LRRTLTIFLLGALSMSACSGGGDGDGRGLSAATAPATTATTVAPVTTAVPATTAPPTTPGQDRDSWTFLVYVMGDTDLEPFAVQDLLEMASVGSTDDVNIVALVDRHPEFSDEGVLNLADWEDARLLGIGRGELVEFDAPGEMNLGDPQTLSSFLATGLTNFPADHYAVVLWDHGAGWPGMGPDESDGLDVLDMADLAQGLSDGLAQAGVDKVDIIGFDACLMATYEVASIVAPYADYMLSSQELEPGHGWNYEALAAITEHPDATPVDLGTAIVDGFAAQAQASGTGQDITLSMLDLGLVDELQSALAEVSGPIVAAPSDFAQPLAAARNTVLSFGRNSDPGLDSNLADLGGLLDQLTGTGSVVSPAAGAARAILADMVVASTAGPATTEASGLSIYFPPFQESFRQGYLFLEGVPYWPDALAAFYQAGAAIPVEEQPEFVAVEGTEVQYFFDVDGLNVGAYFDLAAADTVVGATIFYGVLDEEAGALFYVGEEPAEVAADGSGLVAGIYDLTVFTISDGVDTAVAFFGLTFDADSGLAFVDVPLAYQGPFDEEPQDVLLSLIVDPTDGSVLEEGFYVIDEAGTWGELFADPEGLIFPVALAEYGDGSTEWVVTSDVGLWADLPLLQYDLVSLDPGTGVFLELTVFDYGGNSDSVSVFDYVP